MWFYGLLSRWPPHFFFLLPAEEVQPTEDLTVNPSDLASLSTNTLLPDSSAAKPFKLFIWKKYAFIIVFLITPNR